MKDGICNPPASSRPTGDAISAPGFSTEGWLKTAVPSTVLAAQVAAGIFPDPYFGDNLRKIPGASYPIGENFANLPMPADSPYRCGWWYRTEFTAPRLPKRARRFWLHFGGINYRGEIWLNGHKIADSHAGRGRLSHLRLRCDRDAEAGRHECARRRNFRAHRKDLGINWVDWNPCPPDKDMGLWGEVDLVSTGAVTLRSPMVVTHLPDDDLETAELTVYAELHNATIAK